MMQNFEVKERNKQFNGLDWNLLVKFKKKQTFTHLHAVCTAKDEELWHRVAREMVIDKREQVCFCSHLFHNRLDRIWALKILQ